MSPRFLRAFANAFVVAYAVHAGIGVLHVTSKIGVGAAQTPIALGLVRIGLGGIVLLLALAAVPLLGTTRRLAPSVFVPLAASSIWIEFGALPLPFMAAPLDVARLVVAGQVGLAVAAFVRIRDLQGGRGWLFREDWFPAARFSIGYLAVYGLASTTAILAAAVVIGVSTVLTSIEWVTNDFVRFDARGIALSERSYELPVDPLAHEADPTKRRRIRLVGMMHIGEGDAYRALFRDLDDAGPLSIVLMEGVSDDEGLLEQELSYRALAEFLGVDEQRSIEEYVSPEASDGEAPPAGATFVQADLDLEDFDPATVEWLEEVGRLYSGEAGWAQLFAIYRDLRRNPGKSATIAHDIIERRNRNLVAWIRASRINYREIVVPWGALHLPGIESEIVAMGFEPRTIDWVPLISWSTLAGALLGQDRAVREEAE